MRIPWAFSVLLNFRGIWAQNLFNIHFFKFMTNLLNIVSILMSDWFIRLFHFFLFFRSNRNTILRLQIFVNLLNRSSPSSNIVTLGIKSLTRLITFNCIKIDRLAMLVLGVSAPHNAMHFLSSPHISEERGQSHLVSIILLSGWYFFIWFLSHVPLPPPVEFTFQIS